VHTLMGHVLRQKGFEEHLGRICPQIEIVDRAPALDDPQQAYRAAKDMLLRHPEIDAMFVVAAGVYDTCRAVIDAGYEKRVRVVAYDDVPSTREMVRRGLVRAVVCQQPFEQGWRAAHEAFELILSMGTAPRCDRIMEDQIKIAENID